MRSHRTLLAVAVCVGLSLSAHSQVIGEMYATDASVRGSVLFAGGGTRIESGSSVTAGNATAALKLTRGGEVRICPNTSVSVTSSTNGRDLMFAMNTGAIEAHYTLGPSADTVMTPDFRILLAGPGIFHFAISADSHGNACVRSLPQNTASLIVTEMNGDGTYQVKPNVQVSFKNGSVANPSPMIPADCGCPAPASPVQTAAVKAPEPPAAPPVNMDLPRPASQQFGVEMPFVFNPSDPEREMDRAVARLRLTQDTPFPDQKVLPPAPSPVATVAASPQRKPQEKKGIFGKLRSFFASVFK